MLRRYLARRKMRWAVRHRQDLAVLVTIEERQRLRWLLPRWSQVVRLQAEASMQLAQMVLGDDPWRAPMVAGQAPTLDALERKP